MHAGERAYSRKIDWVTLRGRTAVISRSLSSPLCKRRGLGRRKILHLWDSFHYSEFSQTLIWQFGKQFVFRNFKRHPIFWQDEHIPRKCKDNFCFVWIRNTSALKRELNSTELFYNLAKSGSLLGLDVQINDLFTPFLSTFLRMNGWQYNVWLCSITALTQFIGRNELVYCGT